jgi:hypothetical protein
MSTTKSPTHDIFLCHASKDKPDVRRLALELQDLGIRAWYDAWELGPGDSLIKKIGSAITETSDFGIVVSRHSVASQWCTRELDEALSIEIASDVRKVIPIRLEKVTMPPFLKGKLYVDLSKPDGVLRLASAVRRIPPMEVDAFVGLHGSKSFADIAKFIVEASANDPLKKIGRKDWEILKRTLGRHGINIGGEIEIRNLRTGKLDGAC